MQPHSVVLSFIGAWPAVGGVFGFNQARHWRRTLALRRSWRRILDGAAAISWSAAEWIRNGTFALGRIQGRWRWWRSRRLLIWTPMAALWIWFVCRLVVI